jgi:dolichol-phosphate mannosyltransferase
MSVLRLDPAHKHHAHVTHPNAACRPEPVEHQDGPRGQILRHPLISVVIPAKNEAASLPSLLAEVMQALDKLQEPSTVAGVERPTTFEVIVVDDGSTDETRELLAALAESYPTLRPLSLTASVGQSACLLAGIRHARGEWIATLDGDLQNYPADLSLLWAALTGYDAVLGWRVKRADSWSKRVISLVANRVRNAVLGQAIQDTGCSLRIFPRRLALRLPAFRGMHRFLGPLLLREGCRIIQVPVSHRPRLHGQSHYNLWNRSWSVLIDLLGVAWLMHRAVVYQEREPPHACLIVDSTSVVSSAGSPLKACSECAQQVALSEVAKP